MRTTPITVSQRCVRVNRRELAGARRPEHPPADGVAIGPEPAGQALVDDDGRRGWLVVPLIEVTAANERRAHGFEVARRDDAAHAAHDGLPWLGNVSLGHDDAGLGAASDRDNGRRAGRGDPRKLSNRRERPVQERSRGVIGREPRSGQTDGAGDHVLRSEPRVHRQRVAEADPQQGRAHEQDERARHLRDDQGSPRRSKGPPVRAASRALVQHRSEPHGVERGRRHETDQDAREHAETER